MTFKTIRAGRFDLLTPPKHSKTVRCVFKSYIKEFVLPRGVLVGFTQEKQHFQNYTVYLQSLPEHHQEFVMLSVSKWLELRSVYNYSSRRHNLVQTCSSMKTPLYHVSVHPNKYKYLLIVRIDSGPSQ